MAAERHRGTTDVRVERAVTVARPAEELYAFWRRMENLARFVVGVESIRPLGGDRYRWTTMTSDGRRLEWDAEIMDDSEGKGFAWAALPDSEVAAWGAVRFLPAPGGRGTEVILHQRFEPPSSTRVSEWFWNLFGRDPGSEVQRNLRRFQQLVEAGEIATAGEGR